MELADASPPNYDSITESKPLQFASLFFAATSSTIPPPIGTTQSVPSNQNQASPAPHFSTTTTCISPHFSFQNAFSTVNKTFVSLCRILFVSLFALLLLVQSNSAEDPTRYTSNCCVPDSYRCSSSQIKTIVCKHDPECCYSSWSNECVEMALLFACPKECGDGVCAMSRENPEHEENCETCPQDCGVCFNSMQCDNKLPDYNTTAPSRNTNSQDPDLDDQWHLKVAHVREAWKQYALYGHNITVAIVDDGLQWQHEDLQCNYSPELSYDVDRDQPTVYSWEYDNHGTSCAGLVGARDNSVCGRGAAFRSTLVGLRTLGATFSDAVAGRALSWKPDSIEIYSNSWGPYDNGATIERYPISAHSVKKGTQFGRQGLGNIYVWAAGNGRESGDSSNYDELCNSIYTISVAATDSNGIYSTYSEAGSNVLINAPSSNLQFGRTTSGIVTTDRLGFTGYNAEGCFSKFGGTSAAAPLAAGIIALILESNPQLTWRDMQHVLVHSAERTQVADASWIKNAAGHYFSPNYGFGRIHATNGITTARDWKSLKQTPHLYLSQVADLNSIDEGVSGVYIPEDQLDPLVIEFSPGHLDFVVEHVAVEMSISKGVRGQFVMAVQSPSGSVSVLAAGRARDKGNLEKFPFTSAQFWGEKSRASDVSAEDNVWKVILYDRVKDLTKARLEYLQLSVYGLPKQNMVATFSGTNSERDQSPENGDFSSLLTSSYMGHKELIEGKLDLYWSVDGLYGEVSFALYVSEDIRNEMGFVTLAFPMDTESETSSALDVLVFYMDADSERTGRIEDRYSVSGSISDAVLDSSLENGQNNVRTVYAGYKMQDASTSRESAYSKLYLFERSLDTKDNGFDALFEKDSSIRILWSYGVAQGNYSQLSEPSAQGETKITLMTAVDPYSPNGLLDLWEGWKAVILLGSATGALVCVGGCASISLLLYLFFKRKYSAEQDPHVELHEEELEEVPQAAASGAEDVVDEEEEVERSNPYETQ